MKIGEIAVPLAQNVLATLATMASASVIDGAIQNKMRGKGVVRTRKGITLIVMNEYLDDIGEIKRLLNNPNVSIYGVVKTEKNEIKR